jgi:hypothetical protein
MSFYGTKGRREYYVTQMVMYFLVNTSTYVIYNTNTNVLNKSAVVGNSLHFDT